MVDTITRYVYGIKRISLLDWKTCGFDFFAGVATTTIIKDECAGSN